MKKVFLVIFLTILVSSSSCFGSYENVPPHSNDHKKLQNSVGAAASVQIVNVDDFGAKADGRSDDSQAFKKAWRKACDLSQQSLILIPNKTYLMKPTNFSGPCKSALKLEIQGTIEAFTNMSLYEKNILQWILFKTIRNLEVYGGGTINGNGEVWWNISCKVKKSEPCNDKGAPSALTFFQCTNLRVTNLRIENPQKMHVNISYCENVEASNFTLTAPENSPNTDGIHVGNTNNITIKSSVITTGDDCISIVSGSKNVNATGIVCGPGHGISIGSLGKYGYNDHVSDVLVDGAIFSGTANGVRIKTWQDTSQLAKVDDPQTLITQRSQLIRILTGSNLLNTLWYPDLDQLRGGRGYAKNIVFKNLVMENVTNPMIIDQNYCDQVEPCQRQKLGVHVKNVAYKNISGTSASEVAIKFDCSETVPCNRILFENVHLTGPEGVDAKATCNNVELDYMGESITPLCPFD